MSEEIKEFDFVVGFTIFSKCSYKTMYRHFNKLEVAKLFANNVNLKNNCKIYVDLLYYEELENIIKKYANDLYRSYDYDMGISNNFIEELEKLNIISREANNGSRN